MRRPTNHLAATRACIIHEVVQVGRGMVVNKRPALQIAMYDEPLRYRRKQYSFVSKQKTNMAGHGGDDGHGHHGGSGPCSCEHDHDDDDSLERGALFSLYLKIDTERVRCLNEAHDGSAKTIFKPWHERMDREKVRLLSFFIFTTFTIHYSVSPGCIGTYNIFHKFFPP